MTPHVGLLMSVRVLSAVGQVVLLLVEKQRRGLRYHRGRQLGRLSTKYCTKTWGCLA
jgi:hypothetical protein